MRLLDLFLATAIALTFVPAGKGAETCRYIKSREGLTGYEIAGPYALDHFYLTKGRTDLRRFLWNHWHEHRKGIVEAKVQTVDRGIVTVVYLIQPDSTGNWGIDVELDRPMDPPCIALHADSVLRLPIHKPSDDLSQTSGLWPSNEIPSERLADSDAKDSKFYQILLVRNKKPLTDVI